MKKINLLNSEAYNPFRVKVLLFLFFFAFTMLAFAHPITVISDDSKNEPPKSIHDSLSLKTINADTAKIYIAEGTVFYNTQEIHGNVEIIQIPKILKAEKNKANRQLAKVLPKKKDIIKSKIEEEYPLKARFTFTHLPFESHTVFSGCGENSITVPTTNSPIRIVALAVQYHISFYVPSQEKHNSKYIMSFANEINHWQMHIRPPPAV